MRPLYAIMIKQSIFVIFIITILSCNNKSRSEVINVTAPKYYEGPIIDVHLHASSLQDFGGGGPICTNKGRLIFRAWDPKEPINFESLTECDSVVLSSETDEKLMLETLDMLQKHNIVAITFGTFDRVKAWRKKSPQRIIPALSFTSSSSKDYSIENFKEFHKSGDLEVFAENGAQYHGKKLSDDSYDEIWELAQELDIPVGVHLGEGPPGGAHLLGGIRPSPYRVDIGTPFQLEDILIKYPKLRIYVMHFASPLVDEMIAMLYAHPQLYVDISQNNWGFPRAHFYSQLKRLINAGFEDRILWGSDQMAWPKTIEIAIETIQEAPFLTENQKKKIFYSNAVKFLRLKTENLE